MTNSISKAQYARHRGRDARTFTHLKILIVFAIWAGMANVAQSQTAQQQIYEEYGIRFELGNLRYTNKPVFSVSEIVPGSLAEQSGLEPNDLFLYHQAEEYNFDLETYARAQLEDIDRSSVAGVFSTIVYRFDDLSEYRRAYDAWIRAWDGVSQDGAPSLQSRRLLLPEPLLREYLGLEVEELNVVSAVDSGSYAEASGFQVGDKVRDVEGRSYALEDGAIPMGRSGPAFRPKDIVWDVFARVNAAFFTENRTVEVELERDGQTIILSLPATAF